MKQRTKVIWLKKGEKNLACFHEVASGRKRKNQIDALRDNDQVLSSGEEIVKKFHEFFSNLFGIEDKPVINMDWSIIFDVTSLGLSDLVNEFNLAEINKMVFSFDGNKASDLDGFSFFPRFWAIIGEDLKVLLEDFYHERLDIDRLNYAFVVLIPKKDGKMTIKNFKPINLLNNKHKIIAKILSRMLAKFLPYLVDLA